MEFDDSLNESPSKEMEFNDFLEEPPCKSREEQLEELLNGLKEKNY